LSRALLFPTPSSKGGRVWKRIQSTKGFLMQMYERERIYKSCYDNLEIVYDS
jgi:hypothetical protein